MQKTDIIREIAKSTGLSQKDSASFMEAFITVITKALKKGEKITIIGFGSFKVSKIAARQGRNPQTGKPIQIKASKRPKFTAGKNLKEAVK